MGRALIEDSRIDPKIFDYKDKQAMCRQIAYFMQSNEKGLAGNIISEEDLETILRSYLTTIGVNNSREIAKVMIHQLRHRNFMLCSLGVIGQEGHYGFVHRTFLEYFCASAFIEKFGKRGLRDGLTIDKLTTEVFGKHWHDKNWHEVLRLICSMIEPKFAGEIIDYLISLNSKKNQDKYLCLLLAADCLNEVRNRHEIKNTDKQLLDRFKQLILGSNIHPSIIKSIIKTFAIVWKDSSYLRKLALSNKNTFVSAQAIKILARDFTNESETIRIIKKIALFSHDTVQDTEIKNEALKQLVINYKDDPDTIGIVRKFIIDEQNEFSIITGIEVIVEYFPQDPFCFELFTDYEVFRRSNFKKRDQMNKSKIFLEYLVKLFPHFPQLKNILQYRLENDPDERVRKYVRSVIDKI